MTTSEKQSIKALLGEYCELKGSQNKAATSLKISAGTVSQILNDKWDLITDDMWRGIAAQVGYDPRTWVVVETRGYRRMYDILADAQHNAMVFAVTGDAGCGKSEAIKSYERSNRNVFNLSCSEYWNRKQFMLELLQAMGIDSTGSTVSEMMTDIITALKRKSAPLVILDEADKLSDVVMYFFITIYNKLEGQVGIVMCATDYLEKRIKRGVRINRKGYKEIYSRIGRKFVPIQVVNREDVAAVCMANGIEDAKTIAEIYTDSENDMRRVKRKVFAVKQSVNVAQ